MGIIKDPTSWRTGFELGLAGFSFPYSKPRKPTTYSYNGVVLPELPEWDRETYPYAYILHFLATDTYYLFCFEPLTINGVDSKPMVIYDTADGRWEFDADASYYRYIATSENVWEYDRIGATLAAPEETYPVIWANTDIFYEDGTVYLAASEPIPVYE